MAKRRRNSPRDYPRTARVGELVREILGDELERLDDPRLELVSISDVEVNPELTQALVFYSALQGEEADSEIGAAFAELRVRLQGAIARQSRLRRTPELRFLPDPGIRTGWRVEAILAEIGPLPGDDDLEAGNGFGDAGAGAGVAGSGEDVGGGRG
jgi:ribosome-binding factor A